MLTWELWCTQTLQPIERLILKLSVFKNDLFLHLLKIQVRGLIDMLGSIRRKAIIVVMCLCPFSNSPLSIAIICEPNIFRIKTYLTNE